jgi:hypothetical protein
MKLGGVLKNLGVTPKDLQDAVDDARGVTRAVATVAEVVAHGLHILQASHGPKMGKKTRAVVVVASKVVGAIQEGASDMLREKRR